MDDFCNFIAGWGAGIVGLVVGHPMDTVKTNQQMMSTKISNSQIALDILEKEGRRFGQWFVHMVVSIHTIQLSRVLRLESRSIRDTNGWRYGGCIILDTSSAFGYD
ncbi:uncharacterized protein LOC107218804 isoform X5 [Neodiprion lecontei]|uniref:Uncharacterized protein LOC107218804 isoform X5 n=1 Tax=Neodiprion lecontei TaxID=441921 RepID=A0ABM3FZ47_NEOLC|nr:uncharacterized protein LOC107218804 isoform X5 [Neodiprion lecontei]